MKNIIITISFILLNFAAAFSQGYEIKIKFNVYQDTVIIGHHRADQLVPDDTLVTNKKGIGVFKGKKALPGGMYFIFFSNKRFFDMIIDKNQKFSISGDTSDFSKLEFKDDPQNVLFTEYRNKMTETNIEMYKLQEKRSLGGDTKSIDKKINKLRNELEMLYDNTIEKYPNYFFSKFLKATRDVNVPKNIKDEKKKYYYFRNHYFDNFDYSDDRMLRTPIYQGKIETYLDKVLPQIPDTLIEATDKFIEAARDDEEHFKYMLIYLFNKYASSQLMAAENVYVHLAEKYYIKEASWSSRDFISDLKDRVLKKKKCLVGAKSHNIEYFLLPKSEKKIKEIITKADDYKEKGLEIEKNGTSNEKYNKKVEVLSRWTTDNTRKGSLLKMKNKFTIIWFWTPDCSHCREATPKFYKAYKEKKLKSQGVDVLAVYLNKDIKEWKEFSKEYKHWLDFIDEHKLYDWDNVWNPFDPFRSNFDIQSSPVLYMLDKDKKIIAKRIGWEQAIEVAELSLKDEKK